VLSGGGMNGAFTAGVLKGWTASGARPRFDVVTGISTGALIAPFAFLGPEYDAELERLYTSVRRENIIGPRLLCLDSVASSKPLEQLIAAGATPEMLHGITLAHRQGRRLYVGTTNLDTKRLVVWDLGAIASRDSEESKALFQRVLLASCSVPALLPPVPIDVEIDGKRCTELHVDGGVIASVFLQPRMLGIGPNGELPPIAAPPTVYVVVAGKLGPEIVPTKWELLSISTESLGAVFQARTEGDLAQLFLLARYAKANFALTGVRQNLVSKGDCISFDPQVMRGLFDEGYRAAKNGTAWQSLPPGLEEQWEAMPRRGTRFASIPGQPSSDPCVPGKIRITGDDGEPPSSRDKTSAAAGNLQGQRIPSADASPANEAAAQRELQ
jgi:hypothetical protein